jgi:hypothetical protein
MENEHSFFNFDLSPDDQGSKFGSGPPCRIRWTEDKNMIFQVEYRRK